MCRLNHAIGGGRKAIEISDDDKAKAKCLLGGAATSFEMTKREVALAAASVRSTSVTVLVDSKK